MRENHAGGMPREPGDVLCGREIDAYFLIQLHGDMIALQINMLSRKMWNDSIAKDFGALFMMLSSIPHLRLDELERFTVDHVNINLAARKAFVSNAVSLHKFKQTILRNHVNTQKRDNVAQIIQAVVQAATDIAFRVHDCIINTNVDSQNATTIHSSVHDFAEELFNLKSYANSELAIIHRDFNSTPSKLAFFAQFNFYMDNIVKIAYRDCRSYADTRFPPFAPSFRRMHH
jgi:hypothetical protein